MTQNLKWTEIGKEHSTGDQDRTRITNAIDDMEWFDPDGKQIAMMPAHGISEAIKQLRIPRLQRVAISNELAPYGFYGIEALYKNGLGRVYIVDEGSSLVPVASHLVDADRRPLEMVNA